MISLRRSVRPVAGYVTWLAIAALSWWALKTAPLGRMWAEVRGIHPAAILALAVLNLLILWLFGVRWWLVLRAGERRISSLKLAVYRLAAFGISYFTPGTQFGGEPLQIYLLNRRDGVPTAEAIASVGVDKLVELMVNFAFLVIGVAAMVKLGFFAGAVGNGALAGAALLAAMPMVYGAALCFGVAPAGWASGLLGRLVRHDAMARLALHVGDAEGQVTALCRRKPWGMAAVLAFAGGLWLLLVGEYRLMTWALGLRMSLAQVVAALATARLAFLFPLPGGLGALEAGQVLAMKVLGFDPAMGLSISLLIRARDVTFGLAGLWLGKSLAGDQRTSE